MFAFVKGRPFTHFYKFDKFEIGFWACFKWLVSFLVFLCNTIMTNSDKHNNLFLRMRKSKIQWIKLQNTKKNKLRHQKRQIDGVSTNRLLDVWETLLSFSKYFVSNTFSQNIKYCSVASSLLFSIDIGLKIYSGYPYPGVWPWGQGYGLKLFS